MKQPMRPVTILIADDDEDDRFLIEDAFTETRLANGRYYVKDGEELLDHLYQRGDHSDEMKSPRPDLILLDLNMPKKDGHEVLREIKADPKLRRIPVVVLTTSKAEEDILRTYDLGANSFITKPATFEGLVEVMQTVKKYWLELVKLPS